MGPARAVKRASAPVGIGVAGGRAAQPDSAALRQETWAPAHPSAPPQATNHYDEVADLCRAKALDVEAQARAAVLPVLSLEQRVRRTPGLDFRKVCGGWPRGA